MPMERATAADPACNGSHSAVPQVRGMTATVQGVRLHPKPASAASKITPAGNPAREADGRTRYFQGGSNRPMLKRLPAVRTARPTFAHRFSRWGLSARMVHLDHVPRPRRRELRNQKWQIGSGYYTANCLHGFDLGRPLRAELESSILRGGKKCIYRITVI